MNIVSLIMQFLGPAIVSKLAESVGINSMIAQKVIAAAVPAILAGIVGKSAKPGGAQVLSDMLGKQDPGLLGNLGNLIGGSQQSMIADQGTNMLGSLLGTSALGSLTGAVGKFAGIGDAPAKSLMGMLAPAVLGTLGQQQKSSGLDAAGLARMLAGQKDNISAAIPGDFAKMLGGTGLLNSLGGNFSGTASGAASAAARSVGDAGQSAARTASAAGGAATSAMSQAAGFNWWPWLAAAVATLAAWWFIFGGARPIRVAVPPAPKIMAGTTDVGSQIGSVFTNLRETLGGIQDAASAQSALPRLKQAQTDVDRLAGLAGGLPADAKKSLASYVSSAMPAILPLINGLLGNSAVAPIIKPALDAMIPKLQAMTKG